MQALPGLIAGPWYCQMAQRFCAFCRRRDMHLPPTARLIPSGEVSIQRREHGIIDDTPATDQQQVGRNGSLGILMYPADCGLYINMKTPLVNITTHLVTQHL